MLSSKIKIGDVVEYGPNWLAGNKAIGVVCEHGRRPDLVYVRWISTPSTTSLKMYWNHMSGDFIVEVEDLTKITHAEGVDATED